MRGKFIQRGNRSLSTTARDAFIYQNTVRNISSVIFVVGQLLSSSTNECLAINYLPCESVDNNIQRYPRKFVNIHNDVYAYDFNNIILFRLKKVKTNDGHKWLIYTNNSIHKAIDSIKYIFVEQSDMIYSLEDGSYYLTFIIHTDVVGKNYIVKHLYSSNDSLIKVESVINSDGGTCHS